MFSDTERRALAARLDDWRAIGEWARPLGSSGGGGLSPDDDDDGGCVVLTLSRLQGERRSEYATTASRPPCSAQPSWRRSTAGCK